MVEYNERQDSLKELQVGRVAAKEDGGTALSGTSDLGRIDGLDDAPNAFVRLKDVTDWMQVVFGNRVAQPDKGRLGRGGVVHKVDDEFGDPIELAAVLRVDVDDIEHYTL
ncbi:Aste57867_15799 [Aphanomyces stellatus]|uniref:Aste57867_15799 protein n=1 Tax=Aphanomyces stellatus TaxID=120398 RepID=A0A485L5U3_9STRA|nr:hypothetical protein As57867_015743 [Aphanomyces stellatus]VFT92587.1 Aste57867_15799 [Aphanomyces stellatus]